MNTIGTTISSSCRFNFPTMKDYSLTMSQNQCFLPQVRDFIKAMGQ